MTKRIHRRRDVVPQEGLQKYGKTLFADPTNKKYPIDTPGRIKAAWAYIHQPRNAGKYTPAEVRPSITSQSAARNGLGNCSRPDTDQPRKDRALPTPLLRCPRWPS